jgi:hypothetical protein
MEKYIDLAKELKMVNAMIISPKQISFDIRAILKCRWGFDDYLPQNNILLGAYYSLHCNGLSLRAERSNPLRLPRLRAVALQRADTALRLLAMTAFGVLK